MRLTTHSFDQLPTVFGGEFVQEQHRDEMNGYLAQSDVDQLIRSWTASMLGELMTSLRSALSLRIEG